MFDIDAGKLLIIGVIALVVLGPKELPRVLRQVGAILGKMRRMAAEFQTQFMDAMKESEMDDLKKDVQKIADQARVDINYDPVAETDREIRGAMQDKKKAAPPDDDPDFSVYSVDVPPPPETPDAAASVHEQANLHSKQANLPSKKDGPAPAEPSPPSEPAAAAPKKSGEA